MKTKGNVILVTGASSGIGQAIVQRLVKSDNVVYGTTRKSVIENCDTYEKHKVNMLTVDVTDNISIKNAIDYIITKESKIDILINCAGFGISGSVEAVPIEIVYNQFNVNFFGTVRTIQNVLPYMRKRNKGKIINIGSVAGYVPIPFQSMYSASKFALEAMSEALKMEVAPFNIDVCIVEPGDTKTNFTKSREKSGNIEIENQYKPASDIAITEMEKDEQNGYSPDKVAYVVENILSKNKMPMRVTVGFGYKLIYFLVKLLPSGIKTFIIKKKYTD